MYRSRQLILFLLLQVCGGCGRSETVVEPIERETSAAIGSPEYMMAEGSLWGPDFDDDVFGICAELQTSKDGRNMFRWAHEEIFSLREKLTFPPAEPLLIRKPVVNHLGELWCDGERIRFAVIRVRPFKTFDVGNGIVREADQMQLKLEEWLIRNDLRRKENAIE